MDERGMVTNKRTVELLTLLQWPGIGPVRALRVVAGCSAEGASLLDAAERAFPEVSATDRDTAHAKADAILQRCETLGCQIIGFEERDYPSLLRGIPDPPAVIYIRGAAPSLHLPALAVVGTRDVSQSGARIARTIARYLARRGYGVVSGLALGTDTMAHRGALDVEGVTVAVMAHGLHTVAPASNRELADQILAAGGALVSEHAPGVPPRPAEFVRRNRIQSGLSLGSVIVESGEKGGSMHQAKFTHDQRRCLFTVLAKSAATRGDLNEAGARRLMETLGAKPLHGTADLGRELELMVPSAGAPHADTQTELGW